MKGRAGTRPTSERPFERGHSFVTAVQVGADFFSSCQPYIALAILGIVRKQRIPNNQRQLHALCLLLLGTARGCQRRKTKMRTCSWLENHCPRIDSHRKDSPITPDRPCADTNKMWTHGHTVRCFNNFLKGPFALH